jgi:protein phosphatase methylesterase 1
MSDLQKSFAKAKLSNLPELPPYEEPDKEEDYESSSASSMSSTGTVRPSSSHKYAVNASKWSDYFEQELYLERASEAGQAKFHVYVITPKESKAPLFVLHHGAGSSGMSFAMFAQELHKLLPNAGIIAIDAREHGSVVWDTNGEVINDFSLSFLSHDLVEMLELTQAKLGWESLPSMVLVGHSLGGAVVTEVAKSGALGAKLLGYAVLDVVEGSAMEALKHMQTYLSSRPASFPSIDAAVEWHIRSRTLRNPQSARASVPSLIVPNSTGSYVWQTDLSTTQPFWADWFNGMSAKFLTAKGAKLLLLAGTDRLDKELMIGQMQGRS